MTPKERIHTKLIKGSRKNRIARGSGTAPQDINKLLNQFDKMQKQMKKMGSGKMQKIMSKMTGMQGSGGLPDLSKIKLPSRIVAMSFCEPRSCYQVVLLYKFKYLFITFSLTISGKLRTG